MKVDGVPYRTIWLAEDGWRVKIIDQRELPHKFVITSLETVVDAVNFLKDYNEAKYLQEVGESLGE